MKRRIVPALLLLLLALVLHVGIAAAEGDVYTLTPSLSQTEFVYTGETFTPELTLDGIQIDSDVYATTSGEHSASAVGDYVITITGLAGWNADDYQLPGGASSVTLNWHIRATGKQKQAQVMLTGFWASAGAGAQFTVKGEGGSGTGKLTYGASGAASVDAETGVVTVNELGEYKVWVSREADDTYYRQSSVASVSEAKNASRRR